MPFKWPVVGTLPDFLARGGIDNFNQIYQDMYNEYGTVYGTSMMGADELVISDPNVYDSVIRKQGKYPIGGAETVTTFIDYYKENNMTTALKSASRGPDWEEWRSSLNPDMFVAWKSYLPAIAEASAKISNVAGYEVTETKNIAFVDFVSRSAFDLFSAVMYGESPQTTDSMVSDSKDIEFVKSTQNAFDLTGEVLTNPFEKVFETDTYQKFKVNMDKTFSFGYKRTFEFAEQVQQEQGGETAEAKDGKCPMQSLKSMSYVARLVNRNQLSTDEIASTSGPLLMAGVDTTAYVLSWLYLNLASNPEVQTKLAQELKSVLNGADVISLEQMNSLPYLRACIRESHRLTPPAPIQAKSLEDDIDIIDNGKSYQGKAGTRFSLNLRAFPMDPKYVSNPSAYQPERFLPDAIKRRKGTPSEVIDHPSFADPFGRGKRRCLGSNVAVAEIVVLTARLVQDWEISFSDPTQAKNWKPKQKLMLKADPYPAMTLTRRG